MINHSPELSIFSNLTSPMRLTGTGWAQSTYIYMQRPIETNAFLVWGGVLKKVLLQRQ
jgi:hypothetical protein